jgi:hypothetical protein
MVATLVRTVFAQSDENADSDGFRTPIPIESVHRFRSNPYTPVGEAA